MDSSGVMRVVGMVAVEAVVILGGVYLYNKRNRAQSESSHSNTISTQTEDEEITSEYMRIDEDTTDQLCNDEPDSNLSPQQPPLFATMETSTREDKNETLLNGRSKTGCHGDCHNADEDDDDDDDDNINIERECTVNLIPHSDDIVSETDGVTTVTSKKIPELLDVQQDEKRATDNDGAERKIHNREDETPVTKETFKYFAIEPPEERTIGRHFEYVFIEHIDDSDNENFDHELIPDDGESDSNGADRPCGNDQDHQSCKTSVATDCAKDFLQQNTTSGGNSDCHSNSESNHSERMKDDAELVNRVTTQAAVDNTGMTDEVSFSDVEKQETLHSLNHDDNGPRNGMQEQGCLDAVDTEKKEKCLVLKSAKTLLMMSQHSLMMSRQNKGQSSMVSQDRRNQFQ
ncbi:protein starmaker-like [Ptychodera flava]|uniref:protein starmaker-like n=1 Tax=Ptychodera flava TaxID=63121 RepID=UPI003969BCBF